MKMKTNNLPAVLLAVIMAALMILTSGLFDQAHADTDYWVEITPEAETWVALPGDTIPVSAKVYYDFDGENIEDQSDLDFRWTLDDDGTEFASIKVDSMNSARAKVKFKTLPPEQTEIDAYVDVVVNVFSDGHKVGSGMINLRVSSDYYRVYPDIVNQYLPVGESEELIASVYHYSLDDHEGTPVENVEFNWEILDPTDAEITLKEKTAKESTYEMKRLTGNFAFVTLEAKWYEGEDTRFEYSSFWLKDIPEDLNDYQVSYQGDLPLWQYFADEGTVIPRSEIVMNTNVFYDNLLLQEGKDYELVIYRYDGYNEETGDTYWVEYKEDNLEMYPKGSEPDRNGNPTEGQAFYKIAARAKDGSYFQKETDDWCDFVYMYSNSCISGYMADFYYNHAYAEYLDDEPWVRYDVTPGTDLDPIVSLNDTELEEGKDYKVIYTGLTVDYQGEEFPSEPGVYEAVAEGYGDYYGQTYTQTIKVGKVNKDFSASGKTVKVKLAKKKSKTTKKVTIAKSKAFKSSGNVGKVTYKKLSGNSKISVSSAGKVTVKKGLKKGKYKVKVEVTDGETDVYFGTPVTVTVTVKVVK